jgi:hypothetical protein
MTADWFRSWHGAPTDPKWLMIAARAKVLPGMVVAVAWALFDRASSAEDRGSIAGFDPESFACFTGFKTAQIEAVVAAMRDKGVIAGERLANWEKRQTKHERERAPDLNVAERVRRSREAKKLAAEAPGKPAVDPDPAAEPSAAPPGAPATPDEALRDVTHVTPCNATESESEEIREESSSVVVPFPAREPARPPDDDEILVSRIKRALGAKGEERTIRAGLPVVRSWLAEGCELEADVLPELADVATHASRPLATFRAEFLGRQVRARRDGRLVAGKARAAAPERVFVAEGTSERVVRVAAGHKAGLTTSAEVAGKRVRGWWFPTPEARSPELGERAPGGP